MQRWGGAELKTWIFLIDDTIDLSNGVKKDIKEDTGRTKALRTILGNIADNPLFNDIPKDAFMSHVQVFTDQFTPRNENECSGHTLSFLALPKPFILFIHTSNRCFSAFVNRLLLEKPVDSWIVCYSGVSDEPSEYKNLNNNGFHRINFFGGIGRDDENVNINWDIPAFVSSVLDKKSNAFDYLVPKTKTYLLNLYPLCLGYLDAHSKTTINKETTESETWWKGVLGDNLQGDGLKDELRELKEDENEKLVNELIEAINGVKTATIANKEKAVDALTRNVTKLKRLCYKLEKSGRLL